MRFGWILLIFFGACSTLPHSLDDLDAVHREEGGMLFHSFQVERYHAFGGWIYFGPVGSMLGSLRSSFASRKPDQIQDPFAFCAERVVELRDAGSEDLATYSGAAYWSARCLLSDPYVLSRIFAAENLAVLGKEIVTRDSFRAAQIQSSNDYGDLVRARSQEIVALVNLERAGQGQSDDLDKLKAWVEEVTVIPFRDPKDGLVIAQVFSRLALGISGEKAEVLSRSAQRLLRRSIPQTLLEGLADPNEFVRESCVAGLHALMGKDVLVLLVRRLQSEVSPIVLRKLAQLCGELSFEEATRTKNESPLEFLAKAVRDPDGSVSVNAMQSLSRITGRETTLDREFWRSWWENYLLKE